jgi:hypothetical protein
VGRFAHSIIPSVSSKPRFADWKKGSNVVTTILRIISVHCGVNRHMKRFESVEDGICVVVTTILRIISVHCGVNRHMKRFESVEDGICVCLERP